MTARCTLTLTVANRSGTSCCTLSARSSGLISRTSSGTASDKHEPAPPSMKNPPPVLADDLDFDYKQDRKLIMPTLKRELADGGCFGGGGGGFGRPGGARTSSPGLKARSGTGGAGARRGFVFYRNSVAARRSRRRFEPS